MAIAGAKPMRNALSIDVEDYFQVAAFRHDIRPEEWDRWPSRVAGNVGRILDWLDGHRLFATFFILGWVARRQPALIREIQRRGHEIASHGEGHQLIYDIGPTRFRQDVRVGKNILEEICGIAVNGYRAPSYSITARSLWALDILIEEGFTYDSSIFPIVHDLYGIPGGQRFPHLIRRPAGWLREFPISTWNLRLAGWECRIPVGGGGYLRLFPAPVVLRAFTRLNGEEGQPGILYFHPWEIDPDQPRVGTGYRSRFRHYLNLERTFSKLEYLVRRLSFAPVVDILDEVLPGATGTGVFHPDPVMAAAAIGIGIDPLSVLAAGDTFGTTGEGNGKTAHH